MSATLRQYLKTYGREYAASALFADLDAAEDAGATSRALKLRSALIALGEL